MLGSEEVEAVKWLDLFIKLETTVGNLEYFSLAGCHLEIEG